MLDCSRFKVKTRRTYKKRVRTTKRIVKTEGTCVGDQKVETFAQKSNGSALNHGDFVDGESFWTDFEIRVTDQGKTSQNEDRRVQIFNASSTTYSGEDTDLLNPSAGNILIISEQNVQSPENAVDDSAFGGKIWIDFRRDVKFEYAKYIDIEQKGKITFYNSDEDKISDQYINKNSNNVMFTDVYNVEYVRSVEIEFKESGGFVEFGYQLCCPEGSYPDCAGVCGGPHIRDCEGNCYDPNTETPKKFYDCAGVCGGDAKYDCKGICNGPHEVDCEGTCYDASTQNPPKILDCNGVCGGDAKYDCLGVCGGNTTLDCNGICGGNSILDCNDVCGGPSIRDCAGVCGGNSIFDCAGNCFDPTQEDPPVVRDCEGICGGTATYDCRGDCIPQDCYYDPPGPIFSRSKLKKGSKKFVSARRFRRNK